MCLPKCRDLDYIDFIVATSVTFSCIEAAAVQPITPTATPLTKRKPDQFARRATTPGYPSERSCYWSTTPVPR